MEKKSTQHLNTNRSLKVNHYFYLCCSAIVILLLCIINLETFFRNQKVLGASIQKEEKLTNNIKRDVSYWKNFLSINSTYFDGWVELTKLEIESGNFEEASVSLQKAKRIDPNSLEITNLEQLLFIK